MASFPDSGREQQQGHPNASGQARRLRGQWLEPSIAPVSNQSDGSTFVRHPCPFWWDSTANEPSRMGSLLAGAIPDSLRPGRCEPLVAGSTTLISALSLN